MQYASLDNTFADTLNTVLSEMFVEKAYVSQDIAEKSPEVLAFIKQALGDVPVEAIPHEQFKEQTKNSRAIIRTGEFTPFANVILVSGPWGFEL